MPSPLHGKKILLGVCGSIAAFKGCEFVRSLRKLGAEVTVVLTAGGERFVSSLTFSALSANKVYGGMFADEEERHRIPHISLSRDHDLILIAPATAQTIARLSMGMADDLLSAVVLAANIPVVVCPAMNTNMYNHPATQHNLQNLTGYGYTIVQPDSGKMACDEEGPGRLADWDDICLHLECLFTRQDLAGKRVLITAGPTEEPLDPVRFLSNNSSGKMGYALAQSALRRGAEVTLISGPTDLAVPCVDIFARVRTAAEMQNAVHAHFKNQDILIMVAAVSDFRPAHYAKHKLKKAIGELSLPLVANDDILLSLADHKDRPFMVGFAAESENHLQSGQDKLQRKNLDMIVVNDISNINTGFKSDTNAVTLLHRSGQQVSIPLTTKLDVSMAILDEIVEVLS
jgi:phosphopantothenoylcysteine decarboxylase/phosphopantothenate--cysteine ligase